METEFIFSTMLNEKDGTLNVIDGFKIGYHKNCSNGHIRWTNKNVGTFIANRLN